MSQYLERLTLAVENFGKAFKPIKGIVIYGAVFIMFWIIILEILYG